MSNMTTDKPGTQLSKPATKKPAAKKAAKPKASESASTYVDPVNAPLAPNAPVDDTDARVFAQGRTAALGGIGEHDAPYDKADANHKTWLKGFKSV